MAQNGQKIWIINLKSNHSSWESRHTESHKPNSKQTNEQKIILNEEKTKIMIFNFTKTHQVTTRIKLKEKMLKLWEKKEITGDNNNKK